MLWHVRLKKGSNCAILQSYWAWESILGDFCKLHCETCFLWHFWSRLLTLYGECTILSTTKINISTPNIYVYINIMRIFIFLSKVFFFYQICIPKIPQAMESDQLHCFGCAFTFVSLYLIGHESSRQELSTMWKRLSCIDLQSVYSDDTLINIL